MGVCDECGGGAGTGASRILDPDGAILDSSSAVTNKLSTDKLDRSVGARTIDSLCELDRVSFRDGLTTAASLCEVVLGVVCGSAAV